VTVDAALAMLDRALDALNATDMGSLPAAVQAAALRGLERAEAKHTAARTGVLAAFTAQSGCTDDGQGSARLWLTWQTRVTRGAAASWMAWPRRDHQPASVCHVHHLVPRAAGGPPTLANLVPLCSFHHLIVIHRWGWTLALHPDGSTTAASPDRARVLHSHGPPGRAA
jgi:hypothetical protein